MTWSELSFQTDSEADGFVRLKQIPIPKCIYMIQTDADSDYWNRNRQTIDIHTYNF